MSKKKSRFSLSDGGKYSWAAIDKFAIRTKRGVPKESSLAYIAGVIENTRVHREDKARQKAEKGLNWTLIRRLLDLNPRLSLPEAKTIASNLTGGSQ